MFVGGSMKAHRRKALTTKANTSLSIWMARVVASSDSTSVGDVCWCVFLDSLVADASTAAATAAPATATLVEAVFVVDLMLERMNELSSLSDRLERVVCDDDDEDADEPVRFLSEAKLTAERDAGGARGFAGTAALARLLNELNDARALTLAVDDDAAAFDRSNETELLNLATCCCGCCSMMIVCSCRCRLSHGVRLEKEADDLKNGVRDPVVAVAAVEAT